MSLTLREYIFVAGLLALLGGSYSFIFQKANEHRADLKTDIEQKQKSLENLRKSTAGLEDLQNKIVDLQEAIAFFESKLPPQNDVERIVQDITYVAKANSLLVRSIKPLRVERASRYNEEPIEMTVSGDFNGFYAYLLDLEKLPRVMRITKMDLQKTSDREGELTAVMTLSIFFEPDTAPLKVSTVR